MGKQRADYKSLVLARKVTRHFVTPERLVMLVILHQLAVLVLKRRVKFLLIYQVKRGNVSDSFKCFTFKDHRLRLTSVLANNKEFFYRFCYHKNKKIFFTTKIGKLFKSDQTAGVFKENKEQKKMSPEITAWLSSLTLPLTHGRCGRTRSRNFMTQQGKSKSRETHLVFHLSHRVHPSFSSRVLTNASHTRYNIAQIYKNIFSSI